MHYILLAMATRSTPELLIAPISSAAPGPLYLQIINSLKREISEGRLAAGSPLPSFRQLAENLLVSVITVRRAYEELERDGIIYRRQGLGTFVSDMAPDRSRAVKTDRARALFREGVREAFEAGFGSTGILQLVRALIREDADSHPAAEGATKHVRQRA
jgi:GntR family transcriptional regulator